jgi:hypothetical protein
LLMQGGPAVIKRMLEKAWVKESDVSNFSSITNHS